MSSRFASGKYSIADCDRCGQRYLLKELKKELIKTKLYNIKVCPECWDPDHPQLKVGMYPITDPQAVREPRPDPALVASRDIQWGWNPVGGASQFTAAETPNTLVGIGNVGTVTVTTA